MRLDVTVYDNGGKTADRYALVINGDMWDISENGNMPNGVCMYSGKLRAVDKPEDWLYPAHKIPFHFMEQGARIAALDIIQNILLGPVVK
jgi:hypothetical protein